MLGDLNNGLGTTNATDFMPYHNNFYIITFSKLLHDSLPQKTALC